MHRTCLKLWAPRVPGFLPLSRVRYAKDRPGVLAGPASLRVQGIFALFSASVRGLALHGPVAGGSRGVSAGNVVSSLSECVSCLLYCLCCPIACGTPLQCTVVRAISNHDPIR